MVASSDPATVESGEAPAPALPDLQAVVGPLWGAAVAAAREAVAAEVEALRSERDEAREAYAYAITGCDHAYRTADILRGELRAAKDALESAEDEARAAREIARSSKARAALAETTSDTLREVVDTMCQRLAGRIDRESESTGCPCALPE